MRTSAQQTLPPPRRPLTVRDDVAYILPMGAFLLFTWAGGQWPSFYAASYFAKTVVVALLLAFLWRYYTKIRWHYWWLGALMGVVGVFQWVLMEKVLLRYFHDYPHMSVQPFDPTKAFGSAWAMWGFIAVRWVGASLLVPVMEELFWRDFAWRSVIAPNDFKLAAIGEWDWKAFLLIALVFGAAVHVQWITAIVWGLMIGGLLLLTRSLGACIVMHGVTNFLLGAYVLWSHFHRHWDQWYFW